MNNPYKECLHELIEFARLEDGWGYPKSLGIAPDTILRMIRLVDSIEKFFGYPNIELTPCPLEDGGIDLEIEWGSKTLYITFWGKAWELGTNVTQKEGDKYLETKNPASFDPFFKWLSESSVSLQSTAPDETIVPVPNPL